MINKVNKIVEESRYLNVGRSEIVEAILAAFFGSDVKHEEKVRGRQLIIIKAEKEIIARD